MESEKAPVKATGGGGFLFADRVAALFFAQMLTGTLPLGPERGTLSKIEFENRDRGWLLDDLLLALDGPSGQSFCGISLKSNDQVTQSGFPKDFVRSIWEETTGASPFRPDKDLLALGTARIATGVKAAWDQLLLQAIEADPERLVLRLRYEEGQSSHFWQFQQARQNESWQIGLMSWSRSGKQVLNQVVAWHSMPHRKKLLRDTAIELFICQKNMRTFLTTQREAWVKELEARPNEDLELLVARFDARNYRGTELEDGRITIEFEWPEHLRERTTVKAEVAQKGAAAIAFPHHCRRILNGEETITPEEFWKQFEALHEWNDPDETRHTIQQPTIMAAGITVLATVFPDWLADEPDRWTWCLETLKGLSSEPPNPEYSSHTEMDYSTESLLAEAALAFIPEVREEWLRELIAKGVMGFYHSSTRTVLQQASRLRDRLKEDFVRTLNLMICWAAVRKVRGHEARTPERGPVASHRAEGLLLRAYVKKRLSSSLFPVERIAKIARRAIKRIDARDTSFRGEFRRRPRERRREHEVFRNDLYLDTEILCRGFSFLGNLSVARDAADRADLIRYHKAVLDLFLQTMPRLESQEEEVEGTPYEFDRWVLALTAGLIPQLSSVEQARSFWQPIMDIGPGARYWMEDFFRHWFMSGRQAAQSLDVFVGHWREMIAYSLDAPVWTPKGSYKSYLIEGCSIEVMGFGFALGMPDRS